LIATRGQVIHAGLQFGICFQGEQPPSRLRGQAFAKGANESVESWSSIHPFHEKIIPLRWQGAKEGLRNGTGNALRLSAFDRRRDLAPFAVSSSLRAGSAGRDRSGTVGLPLPFPRRQVLCRNHEDWLCFAARRQPFFVRNSILCNDFHPWNFGFVWSLFHLQVSAGQASRVRNLRVVSGRAAVASCAASELTSSRLTLSVYATRHGLCAPDPSFWRTWQLVSKSRIH
jgi:hypothetical protein